MVSAMAGRQGRSSACGSDNSIPASFALCQSVQASRGGRIGLRHGAVDGKPRGLAHLFQKRGLHRFFPRRQDQLQTGARGDVGPCRPDATFHGVDLGQAHRQGQAMEVDVGDAVARMAVLEDTETTEAFLDGHVSAFAFLGGVPRSILYDNTTLAVARILGDGTRRRTQAFTHLQSHYLFRDRFEEGAARATTRSRRRSPGEDGTAPVHGADREGALSGTSG